MKRINFGSGPVYAEGWINVEIDHTFKSDYQTTANIERNSIDYAVAHHSLQTVNFWHLQTVLLDLYAVLKPGGVLRVSIPDIIAGFDAYAQNDIDFFPKMDGEDIDGRFCNWLTWYGQNITPMTHGLLKKRLESAGFTVMDPRIFNRTNCKDKTIMDLDTRYDESIYLEAIK